MAHDGKDSEPAFDALVPPPPPPPSPPQVNYKDKIPFSNKIDKNQDFRKILALFHDQAMDASKAKGEWNALWQTTLAESQEDQQRRRHSEQHGLKRKKNGEHNHSTMLARNGSGSLSRHSSITQDKRARQVYTASTDTSESGKGINSRLRGRFLKNAPKGSKLMQKFGGRN